MYNGKKTNNKAGIKLLQINDEQNRRSYEAKNKYFQCGKKRIRTKEMLNRAKENYKNKSIRIFLPRCQKTEGGFPNKTNLLKG